MEAIHRINCSENILLIAVCIEPCTSGAASRIHSDDDYCESQSANVTRWPCLWSQAAKWTAMVSLPTPPFEFAMVMYMQVGSHSTHAIMLASIFQASWIDVMLSCLNARAQSSCDIASEL